MLMNTTTTLRRGGFFADAWAALRRLAAFLAWVFTGFGLLAHLRGRGRGAGAARHGGDEIVVYCVHRAFYLWGLILTGFVGAAVVARHPHAGVVFGWVYVWALLFTLATLLFDLGSWKLLLWGGIAAFLWLASTYLEELKHVVALSAVVGYLRSLRPTLDPGLAAVMSWLLLIPWVGALFHSFSRGRKTFSPNSIEEWFLGEGREITDRSGLKFRSRYRDLLESFLGLGAGDLEAVDATHQVVKRWENILFLSFYWRRLDEILHQRSAVVDNAAGDAIEVKEVVKA